MQHLPALTDSQASPETQGLFKTIQGVFKMVPNIFRTMGHSAGSESDARIQWGYSEGP